MQDLAQLFDQLAAFKRPPVETWHPQKTVEFDLRIAANGDWIHEGGIIQRHKLVKLFSTVLALRDGHYFLVTPQVKYRIRVEQAPFLAVELIATGNGRSQNLAFRTNMDEVVMVDSDHPVWVEVDERNNQPVPYVMVRDGLTAKLTRSVYYQLANLSLDKEHLNDTDSDPEASSIGTYSAGVFFALS